jgi:hypothetical protein
VRRDRRLRRRTRGTARRHPRPQRAAGAASNRSRPLAHAQIWNLATDAGDLDITARPDGTEGYEDLCRSAYSQELADGLRIAIASLHDVVRSKTTAGQAKHLAALPLLRAALARRQP